MALSSETIKRMKESASKSNTATSTTANWHSTSSKTTSSKSSSSNSNTSSQVKPNGVDDVTYSQMNNDFTQSSKVDNADKKTDKAYSNLEKLVNNKDIISDDVWDAINSKFEVPSAVTEADAWLSGQLEKIQSGKTSYSDQVRDMMDKIMNREKFSYDVDTDPLFQQALASAMNSGKQAMQDTIGQASALTGGYGSSYATTAGNQAYNAFIEDAYDNLPQYYQMAMDAYQMEGEEMYRQYGMLSTEDEKEFNRNITAYDATYQHRNQLYNEAYGQYRDSISDAFNIANLQLSEHGQKVNDAYNLYNAASNQADKFYEREYSQWADEVNLAYKYAEMLNSDYWNQTNFDESVRQFDTNFAEQQRQFNETMAFNKSKASSSGGGGPKKIEEYKAPTQKQKADALKAYNEGGQLEYDKYLDSLPSDIDVEEIAAYVFGYEDTEGNKVNGYGILPYSQRTYTVIDDGGTNWGWGIDNNAKVKDQYGNEYTLEQLAEYDKDVAKELSKKSYTKGSIYTKK